MYIRLIQIYKHRVESVRAGSHLLEFGIDLRYIEELLGPARSETTMLYTHVCKKEMLQMDSLNTNR